MSISEVMGINTDRTYQVEPIYQMSALKKAKDGKMIGKLEAVGTLPSFMDEIEDNRIPFPRTKFDRVA